MTKKIFYRSKKNRIVAGICGGIAEYTNSDPTMVRLIWTIGSLLFMGAGILGSLFAWIIITEN